MKIKALKTFLFLAENDCDFGGYKIIGVPRSTMWSHISELETETGLKLIERRKQNSSFTEAGKKFLPYAARMVKAFEEGLNKSKHSDSDLIEGTIVVSMTSAIAYSWSMQSIKDFHSKYPNLKVNIIAEDLLSKQTENSADILLRPMGNNPNLIKKWHIAYHNGLFASKEYLERMGIPKTPEDLAGHSIMGYGEHEFSYFEDINWHLKGKWGLPKLTPTLTINSTTALFLAASAGIGICSAAVEASQYYGPNLIRVLPQIDGPISRTYFCTKASASPSMQRNIDIFRIFFEQYANAMGVKIYYEPD
ncbi:MAG: LysR family transcriptional regulator [Alphaproteobacteria bacterium]|nr:LysR family transcriptional regulator [Alphaproteobacteria bacterium]